MKSVSPVHVLFSYLCVSTALCSVALPSWAMEEKEGFHKPNPSSILDKMSPEELKKQDKKRKRELGDKRIEGESSSTLDQQSPQLKKRALPQNISQPNAMRLGETTIPISLGGYILSFLTDQSDLLRAGAVSKGFRRAAEKIWQKKALDLSHKEYARNDYEALSKGPFSVLFLKSVTQLGKKELNILMRSSNLKTLDLWGNKISDEGAEILSKNTTLTSLNLYNNDISDIGVEHLSKNMTLTSLTLSQNDIGDLGAEHLSKITTLTSLNLFVNNIGDLGVEHLSKNTTLTSLNLYNNDISDGGAEILSKNTTLASLTLSQNDIGDLGAEHLSKNATLTSLDLSDNKIGAVGAEHLSKITTLTSLNLSDNNIGDLGAEHLSKNTTLTSLDLDNNKISKKKMKLIEEMLERNKKNRKK